MKVIRIKDYYGIYQEVPVSDALYEEWMDLQRESDRIRKKEAYHRDATPFDEAALRYAADQGNLLDQMIRREECERLYAAIAKLPPDQKRRVYMFMSDMTYADIARAEGRAHPVIRRSLLKAFQKLQMLLNE